MSQTGSHVLILICNGTSCDIMKREHLQPYIRAGGLPIHLCCEICHNKQHRILYIGSEEQCEWLAEEVLKDVHILKQQQKKFQEKAAALNFEESDVDVIDNSDTNYNDTMTPISRRRELVVNKKINSVSARKNGIVVSARRTRGCCLLM